MQLGAQTSTTQKMLGNVHPAIRPALGGGARYQDYEKILTTGGTEEMFINIETMSNHSPRGTFKMIPNKNLRQIQEAIAAGLPLPKDSILEAPSATELEYLQNLKK